MVQSWLAFFTITLSFYIEIVFFLLYAVCLGIPLLPAFLLFKNNTEFTTTKKTLTAILTPFACVAGTFVFYLVLPIAAYSTHWLRADDVIRATNGPSEYAFRWGTAFTLIQLPDYFQRTQGTYTDFVRCHVASIYLGDNQHAYFLKTQYPEIYGSFSRKSEKVSGRVVQEALGKQ